MMMTIRLHLLLFLLLLVSHQLMITVAIAETTTASTTTTREATAASCPGAADDDDGDAASNIIGDDDDCLVGHFSDNDADVVVAGRNISRSSSSSSSCSLSSPLSLPLSSSTTSFDHWQGGSMAADMTAALTRSSCSSSSRCSQPKTTTALARRLKSRSDHHRKRQEQQLLLLLRGGGDDNRGNGGNSQEDDEDDSNGSRSSSNSNKTFHHRHHRHSTSTTSTSTSIPLSQDPNPPLSLEQLENSFTKEDIDQLLDEIIGTSGGIVIHKYSTTSSSWLLSRTYGTVFGSTKVWISTLKNMIWSLFVITALHYAMYGNYKIWEFSTTTTTNPIQSSSVQRLLRATSIVWKSVTPITSFLLVVFVAQSYMFWRSVYDEIGKGLLARMNDLSLLLATTETSAVRRNKKRKNNGIESSNLFLEDIADLLRIYHILLWATLTRRYRVLLTEKGLSRMVSRGMMSHLEKQLLDKTCPSIVSSSQIHTILLEYIMYKCHRQYSSSSQQRGHQSNNNYNNIRSNNNNSNNVLTLIDQLICQIRSSSNYIIHKLRGRMVLAYIHYVEILVDIYLLLMPIALYHETGYDGIMAVFIASLLSLLYIGLLEISKQLLDPFGNDADTSNSRSCCYMDIAVLIREWNASSKRYMNIGQSF